MKEIKINDTEDNQRLDKFLFKYLNSAPKSFVYKMLRKKNIKVNSKKADGEYLLSKDDVVTLYLADDTINKFRGVKKELSNKEFDIVYEDDNILLINKPVGLLCHGDGSDKDTLIGRVLNYLNWNEDYLNGFTPALCNRLDRNTSGIVTCGKNLRATQELNELFKNHQIDKFYKTIVVGKLDSGRLEDFYYKDKENNKGIISSDGKDKIVTKYNSLISNNNYTKLNIELITGKSHQIRLHLSSINHPIIGDDKYGDIKKNKYFRSKYELKHQLLHSYYFKIKESDFLDYLIGKEFIIEEPKLFNKIENDIFCN